jgi:hypothetical protein
MNDSYEERMDFLEKWCSVTDIELIACEFYYEITNSLHKNMEDRFGNGVCGNEEDLLKTILSVRRNKLDSNFTWTENYKKQLLELNEKVMNGFSMAYNEAKTQYHILKERINQNDQFIKGFNIEIKLKPFILEPNEDEYYLEERGKGFYYLLYNVLPDILWTEFVCDEHDLENFISTAYENDGYNYNNNEYLRNGNFDDSFICWAMYELFRDHRDILSWYDILKINEIWVEVNVTHQHFIENIGKGVFWDDGIQSLSDNEAENYRQEYMARLPKEDSGLPVDIYVDEMNCWEKIGPSKRIKFQGDKTHIDGSKKTYSMSIEKKPRILVKDAQIEITDDELQQVKDFVSKNMKLLLKMAKGNICLIDFGEKLGFLKKRRKK